MHNEDMQQPATKADLKATEARLKASEARLRNDMGVWASRLEGRSTAHFDAVMDQFAQFRSYLMEIADRLTKKTLDGDMERVLLSERVTRLEGRVEKLEGEA